jgi:hypothetical protein
VIGWALFALYRLDILSAVGPRRNTAAVHHSIVLLVRPEAGCTPIAPA